MEMAAYETKRTFTCFMLLTPELRTKIWEMAARIDRAVGFHFGHDPDSSTTNAYRFKPFVPAPSMLFVCFESREVAKKRFREIIPVYSAAVLHHKPRALLSQVPRQLCLGKHTMGMGVLRCCCRSAADPDAETQQHFDVQVGVQVRFAPFYINPNHETITFVPSTQMPFAESLELVYHFTAKLGLARYEIDLRTLVAELPKKEKDWYDGDGRLNYSTLHRGIIDLQERVMMDAWIGKRGEGCVLREVVLRCPGEKLDGVRRWVRVCVEGWCEDGFDGEMMERVMHPVNAVKFPHVWRDRRAGYAAITCVA